MRLPHRSRYFDLSKIAFFIIPLWLLVMHDGCTKLVTVPTPSTSINGNNVFDDDATATAVLTNIYINFSSGNWQIGSVNDLTYMLGLAADELSLYPGSQGVGLFYYTNSLSSTNTAPTDFWSILYPVIYTTNAAVEGISNSTQLTPAVKQQLLGEAKFIRAFCYFYLVNLYGDVPLATQTDYSLNRLLPRTPQTLVWDQINTDLQAAQSNLSPDYLDGTLLNITTERVRPTKWAALALLARSYLYQQKWDSAKAASTLIINNNGQYVMDSLNGVFLKNSQEAIWQIQPVVAGANTQDGLTFIIPSTGPDIYTYQLYLSPFLINAFEPGDLRRENWIDSVQLVDSNYYYAFKYKVAVNPSPVTEYTMVLRLAEQYLIRAEAEAKVGDILNAASDLNIIRTRAGLPQTTASTSDGLVAAIIHERQVELFTEWGQRWLDLKRTGTIDSVMNIVEPYKGGTWRSSDQFFPIPLTDIQQDVHLVQNEGY